MNGFEGRVAFSAFLEQDDSFNDVAVVEDVAVQFMNCLAVAAQADLRTLLDDGDVFNADRCAALGRDDGVLEYRSTVFTRPTARTLTCCNPDSIKLPPAFTLLLVSDCST